MKKFLVLTFSLSLLVLCGLKNTSLVEAFSISSQESTAEIEKWTRQLYSPDPAIRSSAAVSLLDLGHSDALEPLLSILRGNPPVPTTGELKEEHTSGRDVLISVIKAFGFKGDDRAVKPLIELLKNEDHEIMQSSSETLGKLRTPKAIQAMATGVLDLQYPLGSRVLLAQSLGQTREREAVEPLLMVLQSPETELQNAASAALRLISKQTFGRDLSRWQEWWELNKVKTHEQWLEDITKELEEDTEELEAQNEALKKELADKTIALLGSVTQNKDYKVLLEAMKSGHPEVRAFATKKLADLKDPNFIPAFIDALKDKEKEVRASAALALGEMRDERAVNPLINALWDEDILVKEKSAVALASYKSKPVMDALILSLRGGETPVVIAAAVTLGQIGNPEAVEPLIELLSSKEAKVRETAIMALGRLKDPMAVKPIIEALQDKEERVRWYAADSLGSIKNSEAIEPLIQTLSKDSTRVRESAAVALGQLGNERVIEPLVKAMADPDKRVADQAADALLSIQTQSFEALDYLADTFYNMKDYNRASLILEKQISQFSSNGPYQTKVLDSKLKLARAYHLQKDWQKAAVLYDLLSTQKPKDMEIKMGLVKCLKEVKQYDRLQELYALWMKELPEQAQDWWQGRVELLNILFEEGNYVKIEKLVDSFLLEDPELGGPTFKGKILALAKRSAGKALSHSGDTGTSTIP